MLIKYILKEQLLVPAQQYTQSSSKSIRNLIFCKYLFKIIKIPSTNNNKSAQAICIKIQSIQIIDNIILRKTAQMKVKIIVEIIVLKLIENQYYQGIVVKTNNKGIVVQFVGGLLEGIITIKNMHKDTIYSEDKNQWILATGEQNAQGYQWKVGQNVRFRIAYTFFDKPYEGPAQQGPSMADLIYLKANEAGLGPKQWWL